MRSTTSPTGRPADLGRDTGRRAGDRSRTRDILLTREALYQLSYTGEAVGSPRPTRRPTVNRR